jgi:hypothetical protein
VTNGKLHSKQIKDYMNPLSCSSECVIPWQPSKLWMDEIFKKEIKEDLIIVYMDDILAFSKAINGLKEIKEIILEKAQEYDLYFQSQEMRIQKTKN